MNFLIQVQLTRHNKAVKFWTDLSHSKTLYEQLVERSSSSQDLDITVTLPQQEKEEDQSEHEDVLDRGVEL